VARWKDKRLSAEAREAWAVCAEWERAVMELKEGPAAGMRCESTTDLGNYVKRWSAAHPERSE